MTYNAADFSVMAYANYFTLWHYTTTDANVTDDGYFNKAADMMRVGDVIITNVDTDSAAPINKIYAVTGNTGDVISIGPLT